MSSKNKFPKIVAGMFLICIMVSFNANAAWLWRTWEKGHSEGWPGQNPFDYKIGKSWLWGDKCKTMSGNDLTPCPPPGGFRVPMTPTDHANFYPGSIDGFPIHRFISNDDTTYYTIEWSEEEARNRLIAAGYTPQDEWFATPEAGLNLCPEPVQDLNVTNPAAYNPTPSDCPSPKTTGIHENNFMNLNLIITPNPSCGLINIILNNGGAISEIKVLDITGKVIYSENAAQVSSSSSTTRQLDLSNQSKGIYIVELKTTSGQIRRKFILD